MSLVNNSANNFKDFLDAIKPYLNYQFYDMSGQGVEANNFSTDEKVIGTWVDGKPLYQKVVSSIRYGGAINVWTTIQPVITIANIDKLIDARSLRLSDDTIVNPMVFRYSSGLQYYCSVDFTDEDTIVLRYTKTTDTAVASGEKIVGQWIDGKPLYEKAISATMPNGNGTLVSTGISIEKLIDIAFIVGSSDKNVVRGDNTNNGFSMWINSDNECKVENLMAWLKGQSGILILRYTKTTD